MKLKVLAAMCCFFVIQSGYAYEAGDIIFRFGSATVSPNESSDGIAVPALNIDPIAGTEAEVDSNTQIGLTIQYMFNPNWGVELLAATPFSHDITANLDGFSAGLKVPAGSTKHLPPTLSAIYYPMGNTESALQPYVGLGVNYTIMFDQQATSALEDLTGTLAGVAGPVPLDLDLDDSVGIAIQFGVDYRINQHWQVNAALRWIDINTDATFSSALGKTITVDDVEIDPLVFQLNVGYHF